MAEADDVHGVSKQTLETRETLQTLETEAPVMNASVRPGRSVAEVHLRSFGHHLVGLPGVTVEQPSTVEGLIHRPGLTLLTTVWTWHRSCDCVLVRETRET